MKSLKKFRTQWVITTSLGYLLGFLSFILISAVASSIAPEAMADINRADIPQQLDPENLPDWLDRSTYEALYWHNLWKHLIMYPVFGALLGSLQSLVLKKYILKVWPWILASTFGFLIIISGELIQRHLVMGPHAGPVEPIFIVLGGGGFMGLFQWYWLKTQNIRATKWLILWISGIILGIIVAIAFLMGLGALIGDAIASLEENAPKVAFGIELGLFGAVTGAVAGWISAKPLYQKLVRRK
ncbi:hypothetical protein [Gramella sp. KN1008]|uniref:hypothetical protein n=1 Tax=Gramella sp. KN1008 TaxID=2529298 RepID=UPI001038DDAB|nr:hypothetical protein [Gramella sp. KN1008]TBW29957.1 hypothetical protein EZJ28_00705 [Gramella sp. KN1008]